MDLEAYREQIDQIDRRLVALFLQRMQVVEDIARHKLERGLPIFHPQRERQVIEKARGRAEAAMGDYVEEFFTALMAVSRRMQEDMLAAGGPPPHEA